MLDQTLREPPHDIDLEQAILGAVLFSNSTLDKLGNLQPEDFYEPLHQALFAAMQEQWQTSKAVNVPMLRRIIQEQPRVTEELSTAEYLQRLFSIGDVSNVHALAEQQRDYASRRRLVQVAGSIDRAARDFGVHALETGTIAVQAIDDIMAAARVKRTWRTAGEAMREVIDYLMTDKTDLSMTTGFQCLDRVIGGWRRKQFIILAGRPSMGKSTVALGSLLRTAQQGVGVVLFSLEMDRVSMMARCVSDLAWSGDERLPYVDILAGALSQRQEEKVGRITAHYEKLPIIVDEQRGLMAAEISARTRAYAKQFERDGIKLGLVIVDHLGLIKPSGRYAGNKVNEVGEISDALATLAKDQDVAVVALQQLNRGTEGRENKRPTLADLRNSGDLEQDADLVCFAYRQSYYLERMKCDPGSQAELQRQTELEACRNTLDILIAKNRNGPTDTVTLFCDMASNVVRDLG